MSHSARKLMKHINFQFLCLAFVVAPFAAQAQQFAEGASTPNEAAVKKHLDDKVFSVKLADGTSWRLEYKASGYYFVNTSTGFSSSGQWKAEDGRLCGQLKGRDRSCNDVRFHQDQLHLKRDSGEIIQLIAK